MSKRNVLPAAFATSTPAGPFELTISSNTTNYNLSNALQSGGWNGSDDIRVTINSGIYVTSTAINVFAFSFGSTYNYNGINTEIVLNGIIMGHGGNAVTGTPSTPSGALFIRGNVTITLGSSSRILGGGGTGGSCRWRDRDTSGKSTTFDDLFVYGGGGAGGGSGGTTNNPSPGSLGVNGSTFNANFISGSYNATTASGGYGGGAGASFASSGFELANTGVAIRGGGGGRFFNGFTNQVNGPQSNNPSNSSFYVVGGYGRGLGIGGDASRNVTSGLYLGAGGGGGFGSRGGNATVYASASTSIGSANTFSRGNPGAAITKDTNATLTFAGSSVSGKIYGTY